MDRSDPQTWTTYTGFDWYNSRLARAIAKVSRLQAIENKKTDVLPNSLMSLPTTSSPRLRFAIISASLGLALHFTSARVLSRAIGAIIGFSIFGMNLLQRRSLLTRKILDLQRSLWLGVPTNAQRLFQQACNDPSLLSTVPEPKVTVETTGGPVSISSISPTRAAKLTGFFKTAVDLAESSSEMVTGQKPISLAKLKSVARGETLPPDSSVDAFSQLFSLSCL